MTTFAFLQQENKGYLLQENGGRLIIGVRNDDGGSPPGTETKSIQKGVSAVNKQVLDRPVITSKATSLGTILLTNLYNKTHSNLLFPIKLKIKSKIRTETHYNSCESKIKIATNQHSEASLKIRTTKSRAYSEMILDNPLRETVLQLRKEAKRKKLLSIYNILKEDLRKAPHIQVTLNTDIHQRGDLMRITTNMNMQTGQIWMRIIDNKGMIVQKAGMVKDNASGFQILVGTKDLKQGKYLIQVSNHPNFSPIGVAEFQVKQNTIPLLLPFIPLLPLTDPNTGLPADSNQTKKDEPKDTLKDEPPKLNDPTQTKLPEPKSPKALFSKVIFKTMMDSRVDALCKQFENKVFKITDKNLPVPPIHFNCRCHLEGIDE